jgi:hypothetical protein
MRVAAHQAEDVDNGPVWIVAVVALDNDDDPATFQDEDYARQIADRVNAAIASTGKDGR